MKRLKLVIALLLVSPLVLAVGEKTFTWTPPTLNEDGSPLAQADIASYNIYCDQQLLANVPNTPQNTDTYTAQPGTFAIGPHECYATTVSVHDVESGPSNTVLFTVEPGVPQAPVNFALQ
ncbi:hypothetical protein [[Eubacterium] cellulosolvens]